MRDERPFLVGACLVLASWAEAPAFSPDCGPACHLWLPGPGIQANLYPYDQVTMDPLCENPLGSENWLACHWASYFNVWEQCYDPDDLYRARWEVTITGPGTYTCVLILTWEQGFGGVEVTWSFVGEPPDLARPGTYILRATFSNYPDPNPDPVCGPAGAEDPPVELDFTITVRRVPTDCPTCPPGPLVQLETAPAPLSSAAIAAGCNDNCGVTLPPPDQSDNLQIAACVLGCYIRFSVSDFRPVESGVCPGHVEVAKTENGGISGLDADTFCCGAVTFLPSFKNGCGKCTINGVDNIFLNGDCIRIHEAEHVAMFEESLPEAMSWLASHPALAPIPVSAESSCAKAMQLREVLIRDAVRWAYLLAWGHQLAAGEQRPEDAAAQCNQQVHDAICAWAQDDPTIDVDGCLINGVSACAGYSD